MMKKKLKRVILAVDLTAKDASLTLRAWTALKPLLKDKHTIVEPVTILNREDAAIGATLRNKIGQLRTATERHLAEKLAELGLTNLAPPTVLFADGSSTQRAVTALLNHAKKTKCDLIAVSSHSRRGVKRFLMGSFAEALSLQSSIPLFVVNPNQRAQATQSKTILYPTDFSDPSKKGLEIVCDAFGESKPKIVLFHSYLLPVQIYLEPYSNSPLPQSAIRQGAQQMEEMGKNWCTRLRAKGFPCKFVMNQKSPFVAEGILSAIEREKVGMVAMVSRSGKFGAALLGSATREVLRNSPRPVWVVHC
jgi:nucleotide-binding universal stress UspA family protein